MRTKKENVTAYARVKGKSRKRKKGRESKDLPFDIRNGSQTRTKLSTEETIEEEKCTTIKAGERSLIYERKRRGGDGTW